MYCYENCIFYLGKGICDRLHGGAYTLKQMPGLMASAILNAIQNRKLKLEKIANFCRGPMLTL